MSEEENVSVEAEESQVVAQTTETEQAPEKQESAEDKKRRNDVEYNWAEARRKMQELERKAKEQEEVIHKLTQPKTAEVDELAGLGQDDIITVKQAEKIAERRARQIAEEVIKQREAATVDERIQLKYPDFQDVVSRENVENLKETEPELAKSLSYITDPYDQAVAAYKLMKKMGIGVDMAKAEKEKAFKNTQKPLSVNAVTKQSAIGNAHIFENGLTPELKKALQKEMEECRKRA